MNGAAGRRAWDHPACRAAGVAVIAVVYAVVGAMYLRPHGYDLTTFICNGSRSSVQEIAPVTLRTDSEDGYDGQAYYVVGLDPFDRATIAKYIDVPAYRVQRILIPLLGHLLSFGRPRLVHVAMVLASVLLVLGGTAAFVEWFRFRGIGWGWALLFPLFPGTLHSLMRLSPDAPAVALALIGGYLFARGKTVGSALVLSLAVLTKETMVLVPAGLALHAAWNRDLRKAVVLAAPVVVLAAWMVALRLLFGAFPFQGGNRDLVPPLQGIVEGIAANRLLLRERDALYVRVGWCNLLMIGYFLVLAAFSLLEAARRKTSAFLPALLFVVALTASLSGGTWDYEWSITRMVLPASAFFLAHGLDSGLRPSHKAISFLSLPLAWFMLKWMHLHL